MDGSFFISLFTFEVDDLDFRNENGPRSMTAIVKFGSGEEESELLVVSLFLFLLNRWSKGESKPNIKPIADGPAPTMTISCLLVVIGTVIGSDMMDFSISTEKMNPKNICERCEVEYICRMKNTKR